MTKKVCNAHFSYLDHMSVFVSYYIFRIGSVIRFLSQKNCTKKYKIEILAGAILFLTASVITLYPLISSRYSEAHSCKSNRSTSKSLSSRAILKRKRLWNLRDSTMRRSNPVYGTANPKICFSGHPRTILTSLTSPEPGSWAMFTPSPKPPESQAVFVFFPRNFFLDFHVYKTST